MDSRYHRQGGYMCVSDIPTRTPVAEAFVAAGKELGFNIIDYNGQYQQGFSFHQVRYINNEWSDSLRMFFVLLNRYYNSRDIKSKEYPFSLLRFLKQIRYFQN